ncbi:MAG: HD domain-containing protein [Candidatus Bathyarchaeota archaeon]
MRDRVAYIFSHLSTYVNPDNLLDFLALAGRLKAIPRTGWVESGVVDPESVADHSFRTALLAMVLSDSMGLDSCKVMRMALLHDLAEAKTGDITPKQKKMNHREIENQAMKTILGGFDDSMRELYWDTWMEYQRKETPEAILVHDADKIEMVLQAYEYQSISPNSKLDRFWHAMVSPMNRKIVDKIKKRRDAL